MKQDNPDSPSHENDFNSDTMTPAEVGRKGGESPVARGKGYFSEFDQEDGGVSADLHYMNSIMKRRSNGEFTD